MFRNLIITKITTHRLRRKNVEGKNEMNNTSLKEKDRKQIERILIKFISLSDEKKEVVLKKAEEMLNGK